MTKFDDRIKEIEKLRANVTKLGKAETGDPKKVDAMKDVDSVLKEAKDLAKTRADLDKRIKDRKKLDDDISEYRSDLASMIKDAVKASGKCNALDPDTKGRDYFNIAQRLSTIGSSVESLDE